MEINQKSGEIHTFILIFLNLADPSLIVVTISAGYTWAHNNVSYFSQYHEGREIGYWFMICAIAGGSVGVFIGKHTVLCT